MKRTGCRVERDMRQAERRDQQHYLGFILTESQQMCSVDLVGIHPGLDYARPLL